MKKLDSVIYLGSRSAFPTTCNSFRIRGCSPKLASNIRRGYVDLTRAKNIHIYAQVVAIQIHFRFYDYEAVFHTVRILNFECIVFQ